ncbi:MAG: hypothetical protein B7Z75_13720 [Acidocella sp. 20-57-95]|nr:MAG: hypothetical protein B7Z75_13720 [Acidocella sp. 20-57-95]
MGCRAANAHGPVQKFFARFFQKKRRLLRPRINSDKFVAPTNCPRAAAPYIAVFRVEEKP